MTLIHIRTLARAVCYPLLALVMGLAIGFRACPEIVGHKVWLIGWAYQSIFDPPEYNAQAVTRIAHGKLVGWYGHLPGFKVIRMREWGEEARDFFVEYEEEGETVQRIKRVWVRWKLWSQNNGEDIIYQAAGPDDIELIEIEVTEPLKHCG